VQLEPLVEEALAGDVGVDAEDVGRAGRFDQAVKFVFVRAASAQPLAQRMRGIDAAREQVEREPAALVVERGLVGERRRAARIANSLRRLNRLLPNARIAKSVARNAATYHRWNCRAMATR